MAKKGKETQNPKPRNGQWPIDELAETDPAWARCLAAAEELAQLTKKQQEREGGP